MEPKESSSNIDQLSSAVIASARLPSSPKYPSAYDKWFTLRVILCMFIGVFSLFFAVGMLSNALGHRPSVREARMAELRKLEAAPPPKFNESPLSYFSHQDKIRTLQRDMRKSKEAASPQGVTLMVFFFIWSILAPAGPYLYRWALKRTKKTIAVVPQKQVKWD